MQETGIPIIETMRKRLAALPLWFMTGWYAGAIIAEQLELSAVLGPILGIAVAGLIVADPRRIIWTSA